MIVRPYFSLAVAMLAASIAGAQQADPRPKFDASDIRSVSPTTIQRFMRGGDLHGSRYEMRNATLVDLIAMAYGVDPDKVYGGPSWIEYDRFNIFASAPAKTPPEILNLMMQSLLADRFHLKVHEEKRDLPAYSVAVGKHLQLKEADGSGKSGCDQRVDGLPAVRDAAAGSGPIDISSLTVTMSCRNVTMETAVNQLPLPGRAGESLPVVDNTGLKGIWNFDLKFSLGGNNLNAAVDEVEKQLGLKIEPATLPLPVINVISANERPTNNTPQDAKAFPPLPAEFDVAELKPYKPSPDAGGGGGIVVMLRGGGRAGRGSTPQLQNGRVNLEGYSVQQLVSLGWDLPPTPDALANAPKWFATDLYTVIAKVPAEFADAFTDLDSIKPLLRKFLTDRFKLVVHSEDRPANGWVLSVAKPKLKQADAAGRTKWINGPPPDGKDPRGNNTGIGRVVTCQNMTMAQFAATLPNIAGGYIQGSTVVDETGLAGAWDFTFYFSAAGQVGFGGRGGGRGAVGGGGVAGGDGSAAASDPSGGISLPDALTKQLGLKLQQVKRPMPALVIDKAEQTPAEN
jgi:uncharacterized protein (TIGR03435 family)